MQWRDRRRHTPRVYAPLHFRRRLRFRPDTHTYTHTHAGFSAAVQGRPSRREIVGKGREKRAPIKYESGPQRREIATRARAPPRFAKINMWNGRENGGTCAGR